MLLAKYFLTNQETPFALTPSPSPNSGRGEPSTAESGFHEFANRVRLGDRLSHPLKLFNPDFTKGLGASLAPLLLHN